MFHGDGVLESNDMINFVLRITNKGELHIDSYVELPELAYMIITDIEINNLNTGEANSYSAGDLKRKIKDININPGETIEITITAFVKEVEEDITDEVYANIISDKIINVTTNKINLTIKKFEEYREVNIDNETIEFIPISL